MHQKLYYKLGLIFFILFWSMTVYLIVFGSTIDFMARASDLFTKKSDINHTRVFVIAWFSTCILSPILLRKSGLQDVSTNKINNLVKELSSYMFIMFFFIPVLFLTLLVTGLGSLTFGGLGVG